MTFKGIVAAVRIAPLAARIVAQELCPTRRDDSRAIGRSHDGAQGGIEVFSALDLVWGYSASQKTQTSPRSDNICAPASLLTRFYAVPCIANILLASVAGLHDRKLGVYQCGFGRGHPSQRMDDQLI
jgi:hypothetical protein